MNSVNTDEQIFACGKDEDLENLENAVPSMYVSAKLAKTHADLLFLYPQEYRWESRIVTGGAIMTPPVLKDVNSYDLSDDVTSVPAYTITELLSMYRELTGISDDQEPGYQILANALASYIASITVAEVNKKKIDSVGPVRNREQTQSILSYYWCARLFQTFPNSGTDTRYVWLVPEGAKHPVQIKERCRVTDRDLDQYRIVPAYEQQQISDCMSPILVYLRCVGDGCYVAELIVKKPADSIVQELRYVSPIFDRGSFLDGLAMFCLEVYQKLK